MFVDSHCHIDCIDLDPEHGGQLTTLMDEIAAASVSHMLCVSIDLAYLSRIQHLASSYPQVFYSVGVHPNQELSQEPSDEALIEPAIKDDKCIAIGETGLDFYHHPVEVTWQRPRFQQHIAIAKQLDLPLIVHTRAAFKETLAHLREGMPNKVVMHCFSEDWEAAKQCLDLGYYISLSGIVSFKNAKQVHEVAKKCPRSSLLIETDSPYLAPTPYRGKQNRPTWLPLVAQAIADLRQQPLQEIAAQTTENFFELFDKAKPVGLT